MSAYRDDLTAARERIRALEAELQSLQRRDAPQTSRALVQADSAYSPVVFPLIAVLLLGFLALRVTAVAPVAVGAALLTLLIFSLRGRSIVVRPNEVAVVRGKNKDERPMWVGPGRIVRLKRFATTESLSLRAMPISFAVQGLPTADDWFDVDVFAVVAVRRDEEGIDRAVRTFDGGALDQIAQAALDDALRGCAEKTPSSELLTSASARDRLRKAGREALHELGLELLQVGFLDVRPHVTSKGSA